MKVKIIYSNEQNRYVVGFKIKRIVKKAIVGALRHESFPYSGMISVTFTDNEKIRVLNKEHRNRDSATDVLSFPMYNFKDGDTPLDGEAAELGDIVISLERAEEQAIEYGHSMKREIAFLTVHSMLHLLGYDHETGNEDEREMFALQDKIMEEIKISR